LSISITSKPAGSRSASLALSSLILPSGCEALRPPENHGGRIASLAQRRITPRAIRRFSLSLSQLIVGPEGDRSFDRASRPVPETRAQNLPKKVGQNG